MSNLIVSYRTATLGDIPAIMFVRFAVKENVLSNPLLVTEKDCEEYLCNRGQGWVAIVDNTVVGFSIVDIKGHNVWALFILPAYEGLGIGQHLHHLLMVWYFSQTQETIWLSTDSGSRAEKFYHKAGWKENGLYGKEEIKFEMTYKDWMKNKIDK